MMSNVISQCYNDTNICLWTEGAGEKRSDSQSYCNTKQRNSFIPRFTNGDIQTKLREFRSGNKELGNSGFWIDVKATAITNFHWIDSSSLAGHFVTARC